MSDESHSFRERAKQCRKLAKGARDDYQRQTLTKMADELDTEAHKIDAEEAAASLDDHLTGSLDKIEASERLLKETGPKE